MESSEPDFDTMSTAERILYVQALWDRIADDSAEVPLSAAQRAELDRRLAAYDADPSRAVPWEQVRSKLGTRR